MPQNSIELLQKLMEKYSRVFMSFAGKQGVPYDDVEDIVMASFWSCYKGGYLEKMTEPEIKKVLVRIVYNKCMDYHRKAAPTDIAAIEDCETGGCRLIPIFSPDNKRMRQSAELLAFSGLWFSAGLSHSLFVSNFRA